MPSYGAARRQHETRYEALIGDVLEDHCLAMDRELTAAGFGRMELPSTDHRPGLTLMTDAAR